MSDPQNRQAITFGEGHQDSGCGGKNKTGLKSGRSGARMHQGKTEDAEIIVRRMLRVLIDRLATMVQHHHAGGGANNDAIREKKLLGKWSGSRAGRRRRQNASADQIEDQQQKPKPRRGPAAAPAQGNIGRGVVGPGPHFPLFILVNGGDKAGIPPVRRLVKSML
jgi:hypothetical protein